MKSKKNSFNELFIYSQAIITSLTNLRIVIISSKKKSIFSFLNELKEQVLYVRTLAVNKLGRPIISINTNILHGILVRANNKGLYTNEKYRDEVLGLIKDNNISDFIDDLTKKCDAINDRVADITNALTFEVYNETLLLELEEQAFELYYYIKAIYIVIFLQNSEDNSVQFQPKKNIRGKTQLRVIK